MYSLVTNDNLIIQTIGTRNHLILQKNFVQNKNLSLGRHDLQKVCNEVFTDKTTVKTYWKQLRKEHKMSNTSGGVEGSTRKYDPLKMASVIAGRDCENIDPTPDLPNINFLL